VIEHGSDIVPTVTTIREYAAPRCVGHTVEGERIRRLITDLKTLVQAYHEGLVHVG
jgi:hypothetical protein